jgi:hypothetical protein
MMKFNTQKLFRFVESIKAVLTEVKLKIQDSYLKVEQMDGSHFALIQYMISLEESCKNEEFCVNIDSFYNILKPIKDSFIQISINHEIKKGFIKSDNCESEFALIELDLDEINTESLTEIKYDFSFDINYKHYEQMIINVKPISEVVELTVKENQLFYSAESKEGKIKQLLPTISNRYYNQYDQSCRNMFAIQFLHNFRKAIGFLKQSLTNKEKSELYFTFYLRSETPLKMECHNEKGDHLLLFLAPCVEENSDSDYEEEESVQQIHSDPKPIINTTILKAQLEKAKQIDMLYEQVGQINSEYNMYEEKLLKLRSDLTNKHALLTELEQSFI